MYSPIISQLNLLISRHMYITEKEVPDVPYSKPFKYLSRISLLSMVILLLNIYMTYVPSCVLNIEDRRHFTAYTAYRLHALYDKCCSIRYFTIFDISLNPSADAEPRSSNKTDS